MNIMMDVARLFAKLSNDKDTKVGCVIVGTNGKIVGTGWNGVPRGVDPSKWPATREQSFYIETSGEPIEVTKYDAMIHAEESAIIDTNRADLTNATLYCTYHPCVECAKMIIHSRIGKVVYDIEMTLSGKYAKSVNLAKKMFEEAGVIVEKFKDEEKE